MASSALSALLAIDISDPTDFPPHLHAPGLRQLDAALRCNICSEYFDAPVTLTCGHCFCSLCARNYIDDKSECPSCRKAANEGHLRVNPVMEEVVNAWKLARPLILRLSKAEETRLTRPPRSQTRHTPRPSKKRKITRSQDLDAGPRSSEAEIEHITGPSSPLVTNKSKRRRNNSSDGYEQDLPTVIPTSDSGEEELLHGGGHDDTLVTCPICSARVKFERINAHMDNGCQDPPSMSVSGHNSINTLGKGNNNTKKAKTDAKGQWSKIMSSATTSKGKGKEVEPTDPLPKASYVVLKDRQLKDMLLEHKLPVHGERSLWIARHSRWVMVYNANLDKSFAQRKSLPELRAELKKWEEQQRTNAKKKEKEKEGAGEDVIGYQKTHKTEFARLVEAARGSAASSGKKKPESELRKPLLQIAFEDDGLSSPSEQMDDYSKAAAAKAKNEGSDRGSDREDLEAIVVDSEEEECSGGG